jgi:tRNA threonylcarbamoyladenosine biosynthesis protein TsaB
MQLLALDTSTEQLSIAVQHGDRVWCHRGAGGAQASSQLITEILKLLAQAGLTLSALDALVVGRGPGSFTGLRTACAVAQGLAFGTRCPVLGIDTLKALAPAVRNQQPQARRVLAVLDARMQQVYAAAYEWHDDDWLTVQAPGLYDPADLSPPPHWVDDPLVWIAGNGHPALVEAPAVLRTPSGVTRPAFECLPEAQALLQLAPPALTRGEAVTAAELQPLYLRDKVALTSAEREALKSRASGVTAPEVST